jgi:uncharacterized protein (TIRG00374 family)
LKKVIFNFLKLGFAGSLVYWLVSEGKIDFSKAGIFLDKPTFTLSMFLYWVLIAAGLGSLRWSMLLKGVGVSLSYLKTVYYTLIGFFFNTAMPGAIGGDLIKAIYVLRGQTGVKKTPVLLTILLDRAVGMTGLFTLAFIGVILSRDILFSKPALASMAIAVVGIFIALLVFFSLVFFPIGKEDLLKKILSRPVIGFGFFLKIYNAFCEYRKAPRLVFIAWICSIVLQGAVILLMWYTASILGLTANVEFGVFASVAPLGILTTTLPLAPGGMGVGHVAFDKIFSIVGIEGGANIFNIFFLAQMSLNLLGVIPYLLFKKPSEEELSGERVAG